MIRVGFVLSLKTCAVVFFCYKDSDKINSTALVNGAIIYKVVYPITAGYGWGRRIVLAMLRASPSCAW